MAGAAAVGSAIVGVIDGASTPKRSTSRPTLAPSNISSGVVVSSKRAASPVWRAASVA